MSPVSAQHAPTETENLKFDAIFCAGQHEGAGVFIARRAGSGGSPCHHVLNVSCASQPPLQPACRAALCWLQPCVGSSRMQ